MGNAKITCLCGHEVILVHKEKVDEIDKMLYNINAAISGLWITKIHKPKYDDLVALNTGLAEVIKKVRILEEHIQ
jgi:hypothetical protein